jgi:hypothetical protein
MYHIENKMENHVWYKCVLLVWIKISENVIIYTKRKVLKKIGTKRKVKCYLMKCIYNTICVQKTLYVYKKKMQVFNVLWYICLCSPILIFIKEAEVQERGFFF